MSSRLALVLASLVMLAAVAAGALGAHTLATTTAPQGLRLWETAVQYQAWHGLAMFGIGVLMRLGTAHRGLGAAAWLFLAGILLFSGSLYVLAATGSRFFGAITPLGGIAFLAGWTVLAASVWRR